MSERREAVAALAVARGAIGAVAFVAPRWMAEVWFGPGAPPAFRPVMRAIGVRDLAIAAGMLAGRSTRQRGTATRAAGLADVGDAVTSLVMCARTRRSRPAVGAATAAVGALAAWWLVPRAQVA